MGDKSLNLVDESGAAIEPFNVDGTTYFPVRAISEALGKTVEWDSETNTVYIDKSQAQKNNGLHVLKPEMVKNADLEKAIMATLKMDDKDAKETQYYYNHIDLNGDGNEEVFVQLTGPYTSGSGGDTGLLFQQEDHTFKFLQKFTLIRNPIIVSTEQTNGWNNLILQVSGGGVASHYVQLKHDGTQYPNPSDAVEMDANAKIEGTSIINLDHIAYENREGLHLK